MFQESNPGRCPSQNFVPPQKKFVVFRQYPLTGQVNGIIQLHIRLTFVPNQNYYHVSPSICVNIFKPTLKVFERLPTKELLG